MQAGQWQWSMRARQCPVAANRCAANSVSGNYFSTLGLGAYAGRVFSDSDDTPASAAHNVAKLSRLGRRIPLPIRPLFGSTIFIQARPFTVIASRRGLGTAYRILRPIFWGCPSMNLMSGVQAPSSIIRIPMALPLGQSGAAGGTNIGALQAKLIRCVAPVDSYTARCFRYGVREHHPKQPVTKSRPARSSRTCNWKRARGLKKC